MAISAMVPPVGLEPTCLAAADFESAASTNSTTGASRGRGADLKHIASARQSSGVRPLHRPPLRRLLPPDQARIGMAGTIRTGMAGWVFPEWRKGQFYPEGLRQKDELHWASRNVTAIEINSTFYQNQKPQSFENW